MKGSLQERLEAKIERIPFGGCWLWTASTSGGGYGVIGTGVGSEKMPAHRASWLVYRGDIPDGMWVLHRCDIKSCVNPDHLFLGRRRDNIDDMLAKGRSAKGTRVSNARLTDALVRLIRADSRPTKVIAKDLGFGYGTVWQVRHGRTWTHVA